MLNTVHFDPWQRSLFVPSVSSANTKEKGALLAGKSWVIKMADRGDEDTKGMECCHRTTVHELFMFKPTNPEIRGVMGSSNPTDLKKLFFIPYGLHFLLEQCSVGNEWARFSTSFALQNKFNL